MVVGATSTVVNDYRVIFRDLRVGALEDHTFAIYTFAIRASFASPRPSTPQACVTEPHSTSTACRPTSMGAPAGVTPGSSTFSIASSTRGWS